MTRPTQPVDGPPVTGHSQIDTALAALAGLEELDATEQLDRLSGAHEVLVRVLKTSRQTIPMPKPGTPGR